MNSVERIKNSILYKEVDRIPAGLFGTSLEYEKGLAEYLGCCCVEEMYRHLSIDVWHTGSLVYRGGEKHYRGRKIDPGKELYYERNPYPPFCDVTSVEEVEEYPFPSIDDYDETNLMKEIEAHSEFALCTGINSAIFHNYLYMCGQENGLCYIKTKPNIAHAIIRRITDFWVAYLERTLEVAAGRAVMVENCNDFGTQVSMFISPEDFRVYFRPQLQRLYDVAHKYGVFYMQHSCGAITPIIEDFIEMGADILNPIQTSADGMKLEQVVEQFYGRITFYGGIDTQYLLPNGPEEKIRDNVRKAISLFGLNGGFILSGSQGLMNDIPYAHAVAMLDPNLRSA
jgi:uroporphyrinogen decarboxylase